MSNKQYDIAIVGGSLAARISAALLAKNGNRVLFLRHREATASAWFHSSLFLEKLLGTLGGRSCFVAQKPIQVISSRARVTLGNDIPLDQELTREFGTAGQAVTHWLEQLRTQGDQLEELLWENGGLPWPSFKAAARFKLLCLRRKINLAELDRPLGEGLGQLPQASVAFVTDLLQGLAMKRVGDLSRAQAALLWAQAMRPENLKEPDFSQLLSKRFDQFHGLKAPLDDLEGLDFNGSRWTGGRLKGGGQFTADSFLIGDVRWLDRFDRGKKAPLPAPRSLARLTTSSLAGQLSPLLASRVICGGGAPLRLAVEQDGTSPYGLVLSPAEMSADDLRRQLEPALPFARYELAAEESLSPPAAAEHGLVPVPPLSGLPLRIGSNLYCADNNALLAEMDAAGAALLGWTLAGNLGVKRDQRKE